LQSKTKSVVLMGKAYKVRCPQGKEQILSDTVQLLNERLQQTQRSSGLIAREEIIMMTALNICHEQLEQQYIVEEKLHGTQAEELIPSQPE